MQPAYLGYTQSVYEAAMMLLLGTAALVVAGCIVAARNIPAMAHRAVWRAVVVGILMLSTMELTGANSGLAQLLRNCTQTLVSLGNRKSSPFGAARSLTANGDSTTASTLAGGQDRRVARVPRVHAEPMRPPVVSEDATGGVVPANEFRPDGAAARPAGTTSLEVPGARESNHPGPASGPMIDEEAGDQSSLPEPRSLPSAIAQFDDREALAKAFRSVGRGLSQDALVVAGTLLWPAGAAFLLMRSLGRSLRLLAVRRRLSPVRNDVLAGRVAAMAIGVGLRRPVQILQDRRLTAPMAFGLWSPTIVLPERFHDRFDTGQQDAVLAHELAHLAGRDSAWQLLAGALCAGLWWHPLAWYARRRLRLAMELAADEATLIVPDGPSRLADCLVQLGRQLSAGRPYGWLGMAGPGFRSSLGQRVQRLLELSQRPPSAGGARRRARASLCLFWLMFFTSVFFTAWVRTWDTSEQKGNTMHPLTNSWRRSVAATITAALVGPLWTAAEGADPSEGEQQEVLRQPEQGLLWQKRAEEVESRALQQQQEALQQLHEAQRRHQQAIRKAVVQVQQRIQELDAQKNPDAHAVRQQLRAELAELKRNMTRVEKEVDSLARPRPDDERQRRLKHLRIAIDNLHAAGLPDQADRLEREFRGLESADAVVWHDDRGSTDVLLGGPLPPYAGGHDLGSGYPGQHNSYGPPGGGMPPGGPLPPPGPPPSAAQPRVPQRDVLIERDPTRPEIAPFPGMPGIPPAPPRDAIMLRGDEEVSRLRDELESVRDEMHEIRAMLHQLVERLDGHKDQDEAFEEEEEDEQDHVSRFKADEARPSEVKLDDGDDGDGDEDDRDADRHDESRR